MDDMDGMDKDSRELIKIFMESEAPGTIAQRAVDDGSLSNYGQQYGSPLSTMPMHSPGSQQNTAFHSMSATPLMPQDLNLGPMPSDVMMQSPPPQQQQRRYPQQHMGYGNGSYPAYGAGYPSQRPMSQTQLSPASAYSGFQQDGGFPFSPTSPTSQGIAPLRSPGVPGVISSSQSMYYSNNSPYRTSHSVSPMAPQAGYSVSVGLTQSMQNLPPMSSEQSFIPSGFPPPSPTQKKVQGNVMANFFQSPPQHLMSAPIRSHQAHSGNIPQQKTMSPGPQGFPPDMKMYGMPQDNFQQMPPLTAAGTSTQFHQQRSCMFDRSASNALQQLHQAQQMKAHAGSRTARRASYPSLANHSIPKSPNHKSASSPRSTPSPKVHSPLPGRMTSPPPRQKPSGKEQSLNQNSTPASSAVPPPSSQNQPTGPATQKRKGASPPVNGTKEQANALPEKAQTTSPGDENVAKENSQSAVGTEKVESNPANEKEQSSVSPENEAAKETRRSPSAGESGAVKDGDDGETNAGINGEKAEQHGSEGADGNSETAADDEAGNGENQTSDQHSSEQTAGDPVQSVAEASSDTQAESGADLTHGHGGFTETAGQAADTVGSPCGEQAPVVGQPAGQHSPGSTRGQETAETLISPKREESSELDCQLSELTGDVTRSEHLTEKVAGSPDGKPEEASSSATEESVSVGESLPAEKQTRESAGPAEGEDGVFEPQSTSEKASSIDKEEAGGRSDATHAEKSAGSSPIPKVSKEGHNSSDGGEEEEEEEDAREKRSSSVNESTQTAQLPKASHPRPVSGQPTTTITAKIIAKGHSAHSNQEVVVAKTPGGQMYLIQGNLLVPVHNITVQEDKGGQGPKVIVVNPSQTAAPLKFSNLVTQSPTKTGEAKGGAGNSDKKGSKSQNTQLSAKNGKNASPDSKSVSTSSPPHDNSHGTPKKRIGRPPGSKDKQKRKSHGHKRPFSESPDAKQAPTKFARTANAIKETKVTGRGEPASKRPLEVPTIKKTGHVTKRHKSSSSHSTVRHLSVRPRGGVDGDAWVCSLCGKPVNHSDLGTLYGPYMARLSRERRDSTSKECKSPTKMTSPVRGEAGGAERAQEEEGSATASSSGSSSSSSVELWVHKECAVWSHGVFMLGRTLHGLEQAVESAASHKCSKCSELGATLACFKRGCKKIFHFACARDSGSSFNEENFTILCSSHKETQ